MSEHHWRVEPLRPLLWLAILKVVHNFVPRVRLALFGCLHPSLTPDGLARYHFGDFGTHSALRCPDCGERVFPVLSSFSCAVCEQQRAGGKP